ncbi:MAG: hypothetical protein ACAI25_00535 [Planctomycetota bacterium]
MTRRIPFKVRFWKRKLDEERVANRISRTLAPRVFYAGCFFYASFLAHGYFVYDNSANASDAVTQVATNVAAIATDQPALERGVVEPVLDAWLGARGRSR